MERNQEEYFLDVAKNLLRLRKEQRLSQQDLANLCSVERSKIGKIENGRIDFRYSTLTALAKALKVDVTALVMPPTDDLK